MGQPIDKLAHGLCMLILGTLLVACSEEGAVDPSERQPAPVEERADPDGAAPLEEQNAQPAAPIVEELPQTRQIIPGREVNVPTAGEAVERLPAPPVVAPPPRPINLGVVVVEAANRIETRRGPVTLEGTRAIDRESVCPQVDGRRPLCWILARTAVRRLVGQRQVECTLGQRTDTAEDHAAPCTLADRDLAQTIIAAGWAFAAETAASELKRAEDQARAARRGLWDMERE